jgi:hypothetical protein
MDEQRRFTEEEVEAILKTAAEMDHSPHSLAGAGRGLTLPELREIGREAGISPEAVQAAASRVGIVPVPSIRRFMGVPLGVGRTIELERKLTDEEWDQLVVDLRQTFSARGVVRQEGSLRSWSNGNLQALLEPTPRGQRLRLTTRRSGARETMMAGLGTIAVAGLMAISAAIKGSVTDPQMLSSIVTVAMMGTGLFSMNALVLPGWARRREQQMTEIAQRVGGSNLPDLP